MRFVSVPIERPAKRWQRLAMWTAWQLRRAARWLERRAT
jgi:hypothetical protein